MTRRHVLTTVCPSVRPCDQSMSVCVTLFFSLSYLQGASFRLGSWGPMNELLQNLMLMSSVNFYRCITVELLGRGHTILTSRELMWCYAYRLGCERRFNIEFYARRFTLLSLCLRHVISRGALVGSRASTPLTFLLSHTFRETWPTCRVFLSTRLRPHTSLHQKQRTHKYMICCHNTHNNGIFIILTHDFS